MKHKNIIRILLGGMALVQSGCLAEESSGGGGRDSLFGREMTDTEQDDHELEDPGDAGTPAAPADGRPDESTAAAPSKPELSGAEAAADLQLDAGPADVALGALEGALASDDSGSGEVPLSARELIESTVFRIEATGTFATPLSSETTAMAGGTGFMIDARGYALTNAHVVSGATLLRVAFPNEARARNAQVVALAECSDLALMRVDGPAGEFEHLSWSEQAAELGQSVLAVGYPLGGDITLTSGIVSKGSTPAHTDWASVDDVIEHTATINPGSSGGPLLSSEHRVVGVNFAGSEFNQYFAIGQGEATDIVERLIGGKDVHSIGLTGVAVSEGAWSGIWVFAVKAGSAADRAGIEAGDLITHFGKLPLVPDASGRMTLEDYCDILRSHPEGAAIDVRLIRWSTRQTWEGQVNGRVLALSDSNVEVPADPSPEAPPTPVGSTLARHAKGSIEMTVPSHWSDVASFAHTRFDDVPGHALVAAADSEAFNVRYGEPGVSLSAWRDTSLSGEDLLDVYSYADECEEEAGRASVALGAYAGVYEIYTGCQGARSVVSQVALAADDHTVLLVHQSVTDADVAGLELVLDSFRVSVSALP